MQDDPQRIDVGSKGDEDVRVDDGCADVNDDDDNEGNISHQFLP